MKKRTKVFGKSRTDWAVEDVIENQIKRIKDRLKTLKEKW